MGRICAGAEERKCQEECTGDDGDLIEDLLTFRCEKCEKKKYRDLNEYTIKMMKLRQLRKAGYPFAKNDLTLDEWLDLGLVEEQMESWQIKAP